MEELGIRRSARSFHALSGNATLRAHLCLPAQKLSEAHTSKSFYNLVSSPLPSSEMGVESAENSCLLIVHLVFLVASPHPEATWIWDTVYVFWGQKESQRVYVRIQETCPNSGSFLNYHIRCLETHKKDYLSKGKEVVDRSKRSS